MTKYIDIKEFVDSGYLHEINRQFLHPLGLGLQVSKSGSEWRLDKIVDSRDDSKGITFANLEEAKIANFAKIKEVAEAKRLDILGYIIQTSNPVKEE